ncbi:hypothetical protein DTO212C5_5229 [Paecilomyces variotii]|nr:hypothetical protein DTO212C5_5229 [Paecilomyces variotii]
MRANFGQDGYTAISDGGLSIWGEPESIHALIECKAPDRRDALPSVQFQEASQIAAWLKQEHRPASGDTGRVFLVSQNGIEVYYIVALNTVRYRPNSNPSATTPKTPHELMVYIALS